MRIAGILVVVGWIGAVYLFGFPEFQILYQGEVGTSKVADVLTRLSWLHTLCMDCCTVLVQSLHLLETYTLKPRT